MEFYKKLESIMENIKDTTKKFSGKAKAYNTGRPSYSEKLIDFLYDEKVILRTDVIADIGSGTGKFSRQLLDKGNELYCVEPNVDMRHVAEIELHGYEKFHSVSGEAENTTLENNSVDCITVAQAFHWFDVTKFKSECRRIAKENGRAVFIWNRRNESEQINISWKKVFSEFCPEFKGFSNGQENNDAKIKSFFALGYDCVLFDFPLMFDREGFVKRSLSSSYSLRENDNNYERYVFKLEEMFELYQNNGKIIVPNCSVAYIGKVK